MGSTAPNSENRSRDDPCSFIPASKKGFLTQKCGNLVESFSEFLGGEEDVRRVLSVRMSLNALVSYGSLSIMCSESNDDCFSPRMMRMNGF